MVSPQARAKPVSDSEQLSRYRKRTISTHRMLMICGRAYASGSEDDMTGQLRDHLYFVQSILIAYRPPIAMSLMD